MKTLPRIECCLTFLATSEGGRSSPLPPGALSGNTYRPHLVVGDQTQRHAIEGDGNRFIGIAFHDGPVIPEVGTEMVVVLTLMYFPDPMYDQLKPGVTFTLREGARVLGYGAVRRWLE